MTNILCFDCETSIYNKGSPFDSRNFLASYVTFSEQSGVCFKHYSDPDFISYLRTAVANISVVIGFNIKFDLHWLVRVGITLAPSVKIWDVQLAEFIASGQQLPYDSLDAACARYGFPRKPDMVKEYWKQNISTENIPVDILKEYNIHDVESTLRLFHLQQDMLDEKQKQLVYLEGEDLKTLQAAEYAGMKFDVTQAVETVNILREELNTIKKSLNEFVPTEATDFNWNSGDQLSALLYGGIITYDYAISEPAIYKSGTKQGQPYTKNIWYTKQVCFPGNFIPDPSKEVAKTRDNPAATTRYYQTDAPTLLSLKAKTREQKALLHTLQSLAEKSKACEMIESFIKINEEQQWNGFIHGQFNQNTVVTGRLSSSKPNLQNTDENVDNLLVSRYD